MKTNETPAYDSSVNTTGCCPRFNPAGWDEQDLHFRDKRFVRAKTRSLFHIPINMGPVFSRVQKSIDRARAMDMEHVLVLTDEISPWRQEHYFAVDQDVPDQEMTRLSGDYLTKVFEGAYSQAPKWYEEMKAYVEKQQGKALKHMYFFYTTCPKCAKAYGKNYVVGIAQVN